MPTDHVTSAEREHGGLSQLMDNMNVVLLSHTKVQFPRQLQMVQING